MRRAKAANNAKHEAGHWITGWILERASQDLVIATHDVGDSYCERVPHPDFLNLSQINCHLGNRIINLLGGAKAESLVCGNFNNQIFNDLVNNYQGAWPDFFIASELFRYYYRSLDPSVRLTFTEEWESLVDRTEALIKKYETFINDIADEVLNRFQEDQPTVTISQEDVLNILTSRI